ncbi:hypothetical protein LLE49_23150 [Alicyclobacillus tolerans]|uniref:hypothetical protein n=1 Tax=Alicyclobacillus tolerans TaxID=90970 RepID=UPI001F31DCFA|nr:hypothetical protein [Alicyclobacillus tolerans]MCF8567620.1 hypothetical protein [Alicyclobacillus tolerans]
MLVKKRTKTPPGNKALRSTLLEAAWSASKTRTFLGSKFWSITGRKDKKKAAVVVAHKSLIIAYYVLKTGAPYNELGAEYLEKRKPISTEELMIRRLQKQGYAVMKFIDVTA